MNRTIKFRGWDLKDKVIYDWKNHKDFITHMIPRDENDLDFEKYLIPLQYTGINDIDGVEIYEGDIVKSLIHNPSHFQVEFIEGGFCCTHPLLENYPTDINHFNGKFKVVGNIFQNPELLK